MTTGDVDAGSRVLTGRYQVHERLGAGGMGVVYRATDTRLTRTVAVKRIWLDVLDPSEHGRARRRMAREAQIAAQLHDPRIVTVFDVVDEPDGPWLILEYVPSRGLDRVLDEVGTLAEGPAARVGAQAAEALATAHDAGIVHRDVKPGNVLVTAGTPIGPIKLADFGISLFSEVSTLTSSGLIGTVPYLAPEVARGEESTPASDVYALGATLRTATAGAPPFGWADNQLALLRRIGSGQVPEPDPAEPLGEVLRAMLAPDPADRPTAAAAATMLWALADHPEPARPRPATAADDPPTPRRRTALLAGIGALAVAGIVGGAALATAPQPPPPAAATGGFPAAIGPLRVEDQRTVDVCALLDPVALARFGPAAVENESLTFNQCFVAVAQTGTATMDVAVTINPPTSDPPDENPQLLGDATVVRATDDGDCHTFVVLSDGTPIRIDASYDGSGEPTVDECEVIETATVAVATGLAQRGIPRRDPPDDPGTLWGVDACALLAPADVAVLPGVRADDAYPGFGRWKCDYSDGAATGFVVSFVRSEGPPGDDETTEVPTPSGPVYLRPDEDTCAAQHLHRTHTAPDGGPLTELLQIRVDAPLPVDELCTAAGSLAVAAVGRLPSTTGG